MKNEVKLNIHMFFPEQLHDEISAEKYAALERLINLSPVDAEDSVEKFTSELESRFALIEPILGDQAEEFLGYCQNDITKLSDFFAGKFVRFGMDAVAVQKILRNIWQQTPCEDKRLNYNLYKYIDEKFYSIVNERKRAISFDHIPMPEDGSWATLENDWKTRRAHYAKELDIDIDYLDGEAVDGRIFPSASGLFAQPVLLHGHEIEFLNFWMPQIGIAPFNPIIVKTEEYLNTLLSGFGEYNLVVELVSGNDNQQSDGNIYAHIDKLRFLKHIECVNAIQTISASPQWLKTYKVYFRHILERFGGWQVANRQTLHKLSVEALRSSITELDHFAESNKLIQNHDIFWNNSKQIMCQHLQQYYGCLQPIYFWQDTNTVQPYLLPNEEKLMFQSTFDAKEHGGDLNQLPNFINSCCEYIISDSSIQKHKYLEFFSDNKIYFPDENIPKMFLEYSEIFNSLRQDIPPFPEEPTADSVVISLNKLERYCEDYHRKLVPSTAEYKILRGCKWYEVIDGAICEKHIAFLETLKRHFDFFANEELKPINKLEMLDRLSDYFGDIYTQHFDEYSSYSEWAISKGEDLIALQKDIKNNLEKDGIKIPEFKFTIGSEIKYFYDRDKFEREREELKVEAAAVKAAVAERDSIITTICHNINGTIGSIKVNLDSNVKRVPNDIRSSLERALSGAKMIGNMVDQILRSYKYTKEQFFDDIDNPDDSSYRFEDMLYENLDIVVENTFSDDFLYEQKYLFSDETEMQRLQEEFYNSPQDDILDFINKNFTNIKITIPENILNKRIGNKNGTATNIYVLFNEFIKNAFRALAYVPLDKRVFSIEAYDNEKQIIFEIKNTCCPESETHTRSKGFGGLITSNIIKAFGELKKTISSDGQQFSLKVIIQKRQEDV